MEAKFRFKLKTVDIHRKRTKLLVDQRNEKKIEDKRCECDHRFQYSMHEYNNNKKKKKCDKNRVKYVIIYVCKKIFTQI